MVFISKKIKFCKEHLHDIELVGIVYMETIFYIYDIMQDRLCGKVVRVPGYISRGPGSIPGATRFSEK
jgi:hypothetical protein